MNFFPSREFVTIEKFPSQFFIFSPYVYYAINILRLFFSLDSSVPDARLEMSFYIYVLVYATILSIPSCDWTESFKKSCISLFLFLGFRAGVRWTPPYGPRGLWLTVGVDGMRLLRKINNVNSYTKNSRYKNIITRATKTLTYKSQRKAMKSNETLESRLTAFLVESTKKLADLISADVFVIVDSSSANPDDGAYSDSVDESRLRVWSGASSLRSAFLRDGLRVRESDVEYGASMQTPASSSSSSRALVGTGEDEIKSSAAYNGETPETSDDSRANNRTDVFQSDALHNLRNVGVISNSHQSPTTILFEESETSSSSRRKRRPPVKRKTRLDHPKLSRLDEIDHRIFETFGREEKNLEIDAEAFPINLSFIDKRAMGSKDDFIAADLTSGFSRRVGGGGGGGPLAVSLSAPSTYASLLSVSPNAPPTPAPPLDTGSCISTARELFDFSRKNVTDDDDAIASRKRHVEINTENNNAAASGLLDLTPPDRENDVDERVDDDDDDGESAPHYRNPVLVGAMERAMVAARASVHAAYGIGGSTQSGSSNDDYYANITHSLFSMLSQYPSSTSSNIAECKVESECGDGRGAGEGSNSGGGGRRARSGSGGNGGGGASRRGGRKRKELSSSEEKIDRLLAEKGATVDGSIEEKTTNGDLNGIADPSVGESTGDIKSGRPRGRTSSENRKGKLGTIQVSSY